MTIGELLAEVIKCSKNNWTLTEILNTKLDIHDEEVVDWEFSGDNRITLIDQDDANRA